MPMVATGKKMNERKVLAIIQARMGSTRFPGKMLAPLAGRPLIDWIVSRAGRSKRLDQLVVATTQEQSDNQLARWCEDHRIPVFRGATDDVLDRFYRCAIEHQASFVARLTGDCPLMDWRVIDQVVELCLACDDVDFATNSEPMTFPEGIYVEVMPFCVLEQCWREATLPSHREHVTPLVRFHPERFRHACLRAVTDLSRYRLTVDYPEDAEALEVLIDELLRNELIDLADVDQIIAVLEQLPLARDKLCAKQRDLWRADVAKEEGRAIQ